MFKFAILVISALFNCAVYAVTYSGCTDPKYVSYVEKRLSFYETLDKEQYNQLSSEMGHNEVHSYHAIVLSARFDSKEVALKNIAAFEKQQLTLPEQVKKLFLGSDDAFHNLHIAKGWLSLKSGNEEQAISYLLSSTKVKGSPVLGSFGPDKTLIRELYKRGNKEAVLNYLALVESFWHSDSAKEYLKTWRKMAAVDCPIQFQFYDTTSIVDLGL